MTSKVQNTHKDPRRNGTYEVTILQGLNSKFLSIFGAYISVHKSANTIIHTVHAQQVYLIECEAMKNKPLPICVCPRKEAIKALGKIFEKLQFKNHAIILVVDANQTPAECFNGNGIIKHSIECPKVECSLDDPFLDPLNQ